VAYKLVGIYMERKKAILFDPKNEKFTFSIGGTPLKAGDFLPHGKVEAYVTRY
jgi:hypothetical protein